MQKQPQQPITESWVSVRQPGMSGINTLTDAHDLKDTESPDMLNILFDAGVIGPRNGSLLFASKPSGESGSPLQSMVFRTSDGVQYLVCAYYTAPSTVNFYLYDSANSRFMRLNGSYMPNLSSVGRFGYQSWDNGYGYDKGYLCNGYDDAMRWRMALTTLSSDASASATSLSLSDGTRFNAFNAGIASVSGNALSLSISSGTETSIPLGQLVYYVGTGITGLTSGTLYYAVPTAGATGSTFSLATTLANAVAGTVISISGSPSGAYLYRAEPIVLYDGTTYTSAVYYNRSGNTLSLASALGTAMGAGSAVTHSLTDRPGVSKGKIVTRWQSRLICANASPGAEVSMFFSRISEPEDFVTASGDIQSGGSELFNDGAGQITRVEDFGEFLVVAKQDVVYRFSFILNSTLGAQITQVVPIVSGVGMGPISLYSSVKALNSLFYPTTLSGFIQLSPIATGVQTTSGVQVISNNINNYIQSSLDLSSSVSAYFRNKVFWTCASTAQPYVVVYDILRAAWTKLDSWNPADLFVMNSKLYYMSSSNGGVYQALTGFTDNNDPYVVRYRTKLHNFGRPAEPKTMDAIYVEGYMTQSTVLYVDVWYNEMGNLLSKTYKLANGVEGFFFSAVQVDALGQLPINQGILDSLLPSQIQSIGFFRCYLSVPNALGAYAVQMTAYSKDANSVWYLSGYSANPQLEPVIPPGMRVEPTVPFSTNFGS